LKEVDHEKITANSSGRSFTGRLYEAKRSYSYPQTEMTVDPIRMSRARHNLTPALIPSPLYGRSIYNELRRTKRRKEWEALRRTVLEAATNTCTHCEAVFESRMVCHEVWAYDDLNHIATLTAFEIVCRDCDSVLHFGKTLMIGGRKGDEVMAKLADQAIAQLMEVNGITKRQANKLIDDAFGQWMDRSVHKTWAIQIAPELIDKHPILADLKF
jgi:hypothetical protein